MLTFKVGKRTNLRPAACCANCKHVFVFEEYDDGPSYYCTRGAGKRPLCGSILMKEYKNGFVSRKNAIYDFDKWAEWSLKNQTRASNICDSFVRAESPS